MSSLGPDFRVICKLGEGSFAEVFKVKSNSTGGFYAVKRLKKRYRSIDEVNRLPEILSLKALQGHPNVVKLVDLIYDNANGYVAMVFEIMDCNVYEFITEHKKPFDEHTAILLIYQLLKSIAFMHSKNLFHRDIKPENCMVNRNTQVLKLVDFGSTRAVSSNQPYTEYVSTRWYRAPECILTSGSYGPEVDEWAVGCMLYELLTTRPLFPGKHEIDQIGRIHNVLGTPARDVLAQFRRNPNTQISFAFPQRCAQDLHKLLPRATNSTIELMQKLLIYNPAERISAADSLRLPVFDELRTVDEIWMKTDMSIPFPVFLQQYNKQMTRPPKPLFNNNQNEDINRPSQPKPQILEPIGGNNPGNPTKRMYSPPPKPKENQSNQPQQFQIHHQQQPPPPVQFQLPQKAVLAPVVPKPPPQMSNNGSFQGNQPVLTTHPLYKIQKIVPDNHPPPILQPNIPPKPKMNPVYDASLAETRIRAAQRIREYHQKQMVSKAYKKPQPFHGGAFAFAQAKLRQENQGEQKYAKPGPDLVHPRLPKIII